MILLIDNYDSFVYNIAQCLGELGADVEVVRNDGIDLQGVHTRNPAAIVLSPGPGRPANAGVTVPLIREFAGQFPILGVCLGHQAIGEAFGGRVVRAATLLHGKSSLVHHDGRTLFAGLPSPLAGGRYHSLVIERESLPACLDVSAWTDEGVIMGVRHRHMQVEGVQFHPESILTPEGPRLLANFLRVSKTIDTTGTHALR